MCKRGTCKKFSEDDIKEIKASSRSKDTVYYKVQFINNVIDWYYGCQIPDTLIREFHINRTAKGKRRKLPLNNRHKFFKDVQFISTNINKATQTDTMPQTGNNTIDQQQQDFHQHYTHDNQCKCSKCTSNYISYLEEQLDLYNSQFECLQSPDCTCPDCNADEIDYLRSQLQADARQDEIQDEVYNILKQMSGNPATHRGWILRAQRPVQIQECNDQARIKTRYFDEHGIGHEKTYICQQSTSCLIAADDVTTPQILDSLPFDLHLTTDSRMYELTARLQEASLHINDDPMLYYDNKVQKDMLELKIMLHGGRV